MIHIHPFPARMAPEIALNGLRRLPKDYVVLDPMAGSGMVLGTAARLGLRAVGYDIDPLACLISNVGGYGVNEERARAGCRTLLRQCGKLDDGDVSLPWIDADEETEGYIRFWFASKQLEQLRKLSFLLVGQPFTRQTKILNVLKVAVSRLIITKEPKASLARDTAHSRPHRVIVKNAFDVLGELPRSLEHVLKALSPSKIKRNVFCHQGDARQLNRVSPASIDRIVTSPPYLNAIDYMRGHRLSLVWLGFKVSTLRDIRRGSVGTEAGGSKVVGEELGQFFNDLPSDVAAKRNMLVRYYQDLSLLTDEAFRVLKPKRRVTYVVGNSNIRGHEIKNFELVRSAARRSGFRATQHLVRQIPENRRYMPLVNTRNSSLARRIRQEHILTFIKP